MIGTALNIGSFFLDIAKQLYPESGDIGAAAKVTGRARHAYNVLDSGSVQRSSGRTVMSPMVAVDKSILHAEFMGDLITVLNIRDVVATLTHFSLENANQVGVRIENLIGSVNPNRAGMLSLLAGVESYNTSIPVPSSKEEKVVNQITTNPKTVQDIMEYAPLSIGRVVNAVAYGENGAKVDIPLTFRQIVIPMDSAQLNLVFSAARKDEGLRMRWLMKRSGEISHPEWFDGGDIVKDRFKLKNKDTTGYYKEAMKRDTGNTLQAIRTGEVSANDMANSFVLSADEATNIELSIGKRFANPTARQAIFEKLNANTIVVCDEGRGFFTFYTDGQSIPDVYTRRDLTVKAKKESSATSLGDLVKLLNGSL